MARALTKMDYLRAKFQVGDAVDVGSAYADAKVVRLVAKLKGVFMYQVEYTTDKGTEFEKRHQQPWLENQIRKAS